MELKGIRWETEEQRKVWTAILDSWDACVSAFLQLGGTPEQAVEVADRVLDAVQVDHTGLIAPFENHQQDWLATKMCDQIAYHTKTSWEYVRNQDVGEA